VSECFGVLCHIHEKIRGIYITLNGNHGDSDILSSYRLSFLNTMIFFFRISFPLVSDCFGALSLHVEKIRGNIHYSGWKPWRF